MSKVVALLLAGGCGARVQLTRPKQYIEMDGESILLHTMRAFERHPLVDEIYVVCGPEWDGYVRQQASRGSISKFAQTFPSGITSYQSLCNGINGLTPLPSDTIVLVHDSVRPMVSYEIISNNIVTCQERGNAVTATMSHEAYIRLDDNGTSNGYIPRNELLRAQTPITFRLDKLQNILAKATSMGIEESQSLFTLANETGHGPLHIVEGDILNFKITMPQDVDIYRNIRNLNCD